MLSTKRTLRVRAVAAWSRHQGAHSPGTKKPDVDETEEQLEEYEEEVEDEREETGQDSE